MQMRSQSDLVRPRTFIRKEATCFLSNIYEASLTLFRYFDNLNTRETCFDVTRRLLSGRVTKNCSSSPRTQASSTLIASRDKQKAREIWPRTRCLRFILIDQIKQWFSCNQIIIIISTIQHKLIDCSINHQYIFDTDWCPLDSTTIVENYIENTWLLIVWFIDFICPSCCSKMHLKWLLLILRARSSTKVRCWTILSSCESFSQSSHTSTHSFSALLVHLEPCCHSNVMCAQMQHHNVWISYQSIMTTLSYHFIWCFLFLAYICQPRSV